METKINVLGAEWTIRATTAKEDRMLEKADGYADKITRTIVIAEKCEDNELGDYESYLRKVTRHEIVHAFLYESGLHENFTHPEYGHDETYLDWFAVQYPKLKAAFVAAGCDE